MDPMYFDPARYKEAKRAREDAYVYSAWADRDAALKRWCETGFGPAACSRMKAPTATPKLPEIVTAPPQLVTAQPVKAPEPIRPPSVRKVDIWGDSRVATLVFSDGTEGPYRVNDTLPDGAKVMQISIANGVRVKRGDTIFTLAQMQPATAAQPSPIVMMPAPSLLSAPMTAPTAVPRNGAGR